MRRTSRRIALGAAGSVLAACVSPPESKSVQVRAARALPDSAPTPASPPAPASAPAPEPALVVVQPVPPPMPSLLDLGVEGAAQPVWSGEGDRVLFYDQPQPGLGGTWSVDPATGQPARDRAQWGYYVAQGTLLVTPRPTNRDTYVLHLPSRREWTLPTTNSTLFSADGTLVAYSVAAPTTGTFGGPGNFQTSTLAVSGADGQDTRRLPLPISASLVSWLPGSDGTPNGRILLTGKGGRADSTGIYTLDVRDRSLADIARTKRLSGALASADGRWLAYVAMWNGDAAQDGLWVMRTDGTDRRRLDVMGGYRWTPDGHLIVIPVRPAAGESHEVWEVDPANGESRRLTDPAQIPFRIANFDWDLSADGTKLVFVSADTKRLTVLTLPKGLPSVPGTLPVPLPSPAATSSRLYRLPFQTPPGPSSWYVAQWYGITTTGYRARNSAYREGQGIHFGIDFPNPIGTPVVAVAPGRIVAVDGDYGSPPHNVVLQLADGNQVMYGHLIEPSRHVQVGQLVEAGQVVGNTGDSSAPYDGNGNPHIHLELRKRGRDVATNPVTYFEYNWDDLGLGLYPGPRFEKNLDDPKRYQFPDDQPDIRFGGAIISNFARPWPP